MKVSNRVMISRALVLGVILVCTGQVAGADPPDPDLTGYWVGEFVSVGDPKSVGEAYLRVDAEHLQCFKGELSLNLLSFDIYGAVFADPPDPDADPPDPDADPPDPDRPGLIMADYMIVSADGYIDAGTLFLVQKIDR